MNLIAITGLKRAGKGVVADALISEGYVLVKFAGPLKDMLRSLGLTEAEIEGDLKETPCDLLQGKTPRYAMQTLGTEWGRDLIGSGFWVNAWMSAAQKHDLVVVDDCRFPNEAAAVHLLDGEIWRVTRSGLANADAHESETHELPFSIELLNDGSIEQLQARARAALRRTSCLDTCSAESIIPSGSSPLSRSSSLSASP